MAVGRFVLHRFNGVEEYLLTSANMLAYHDEDGIRLWFEAETNGARTKSLPDTAELNASPKAEVAVLLKSFDPSKLIGARFLVPSGYDEEAEDYVATIYYVEHDYLNKNEVEVVSQDGSVFHVRWSGTTTDVCHYDGSKPETRVEIEGDFTFKDYPKWLPK